MDDASTSVNSGIQTRQKRILPSRSRRGGPGVGNCDADIMILETKRRQFESEPLIPVTTRFLLTTNPTIASTSSSSPTLPKLNVLANERYFDRPEVLKAYREQLAIETPEFVSLGDVPNAGRLRARSQAGITEDGPSETSDAAYEKRHRKYETFEKRQRVREKEKLKHEQYKLKERMEQLRVMDSAAFLTLPASLFLHPSMQVDGEVDGSQAEVDATQPTVVSQEGERRRKEMLSIASMLQERYRILLPPERNKKASGPTVTDSPIEPTAAIYQARDRDDVEWDEEPLVEATEKDVEALKLKVKLPNRHSLPSPVSRFKKHRRNGSLAANHLPLPRRARSTQEDEIMQQEEILQQEDIQLEEEIVVDQEETPPPEGTAQPEGPIQPEPEEETRLEENTYSSKINELTGEAVEDEGFSSPEPGPAPIPAPDLPPVPSEAMSPSSRPISLQKPSSRAASLISNPEIAVLETEPSDFTFVNDDAIPVSSHVLEFDAPRHPYKRSRLTVDPSLSPGLTRNESVPLITSISAPVKQPRPPRQSVPYISASGKQERTTSALMIAALHSSGNSSRKAKRHLTAFGVKAPHNFFDIYRDYEIPEWVGPLVKEGEDPELVTGKGDIEEDYIGSISGLLGDVLVEKNP